MNDLAFISKIVVFSLFTTCGLIFHLVMFLRNIVGVTQSSVIPRIKLQFRAGRVAAYSYILNFQMLPDDVAHTLQTSLCFSSLWRWLVGCGVSHFKTFTPQIISSPFFLHNLKYLVKQNIAHQHTELISLINIFEFFLSSWRQVITTFLYILQNSAIPSKSKIATVTVASRTVSKHFLVTGPRLCTESDCSRFITLCNGYIWF